MEETRSIREQTSELGSEAKEKIIHTADRQRVRLADDLESFAGRLEELGTEGGVTGAIAGTTSRYLKKFTTSVKGRSTQELIGSAKRGLTEHPAWLIGACFTLGFVSARVVKS